MVHTYLAVKALPLDLRAELSVPSLLVFLVGGLLIGVPCGVMLGDGVTDFELASVLRVLAVSSFCHAFGEVFFCTVALACTLMPGTRWIAVSGQTSHIFSIVLAL